MLLNAYHPAFFNSSRISSSIQPRHFCSFLLRRIVEEFRVASDRVFGNFVNVVRIVERAAPPPFGRVCRNRTFEVESASFDRMSRNRSTQRTAVNRRSIA